MGDRPIVFFPGWGFRGPLQELLPVPAAWLLPDPDVAAAHLPDWLAVTIQQRGWQEVDCIGWSLGAVMAVDFFCRHGDVLANLYLVGLRRRWPAAELAAIDRQLVARPRHFLEDFYRKCFLGHRLAWQAVERGLPADFPDATTVRHLRSDLDLLARTEAVLAGYPAARRRFVGVKVACVHGSRDVIAPAADMPDLAGARRLVFPGEGHAVFLSPAFFDLVEGADSGPPVPEER